MTKPQVLQMGDYPAWDIPPLEDRFVLHRLYEASDKAAFLAKSGQRFGRLPHGAIWGRRLR